MNQPGRIQNFAFFPHHFRAVVHTVVVGAGNHIKSHPAQFVGHKGIGLLVRLAGAHGIDRHRITAERMDTGLQIGLRHIRLTQQFDQLQERRVAIATVPAGT